MSRYYTHPEDAKARVFKEYFWPTRVRTWAAARPGETYTVGRGFHFDSWSDALAYALREADAA